MTDPHPSPLDSVEAIAQDLNSVGAAVPWSGFVTEATYRVATALDNDAGAHAYIRDYARWLGRRFNAADAYACARRFPAIIRRNGVRHDDPTIRWALLADHWSAR